MSDLDKVGKLLDDPAKRKNFANDPGAALRAAGGDPANIPPAVREVLFDLGEPELSVLAQTKAALVKEKVDPKVAMRIV